MSDFDNENLNNDTEVSKEEPIVEEPIVEETTDTTFFDTTSENNEDNQDNDYIVEEIEGSINNKNGIKIFVIVICAVLALSIASTAGYFIGKFGESNHKAGQSLDLEDKPTNQNALSGEKVYDEVNPSVVGVVAYNSEGNMTKSSGVIYSEDGYIIISDHVYAEISNPSFKVYTFDNKSYDATYVAGDSQSDLAVIKINSSGFFPAVFGDSSQVVFGERVYAIGKVDEIEKSPSISTGIVSNTEIRVTNATNYSTKLIQTDSAINPGCSGGALVNSYGQVIGIITSKIVGDAYEGIGFAVPTVTVKSVVESLIQNGMVIDRARLGITYQEYDTFTAAYKNSVVGLCVSEISKESNLCGQLNTGDVLASVNSINITSDDILLDIIEKSKPGDSLTFEVYKTNGKTETLTAKLIQAENSSSYTTDKVIDNGKDPKDGVFDFPYGY